MKGRRRRGCQAAGAEGGGGTDLVRQFLPAAALRQKPQIKLSTTPSHSILTPGRPVPVLTL